MPPRLLDSRIPWHELLLRVFREDILACPCGGLSGDVLRDPSPEEHVSLVVEGCRVVKEPPRN